MNRESIWGKGEKLTLNFIKEKNLSGNWLNLAAGDGRYVKELLEKVDKLTLSDINPKELNKSLTVIPVNQKFKTEFSIFNFTKKFPFENSTFDGVFCAGILHLFDIKNLKYVFSEISRVLKPNGKILFDFATDIKRVFKDRSLTKSFWRKNEAKRVLNKILEDYNLKFFESTFEDNLINNSKYGFNSKGNFFLVYGEKI